MTELRVVIQLENIAQKIFNKFICHLYSKSYQQLVIDYWNKKSL